MDIRIRELPLKLTNEGLSLGSFLLGTKPGPQSVACSDDFDDKMDPENALDFLGPDSSNPHVRKYAVFRLNRLEDDELELYLLQLVQALRYEDFESIKDGLHSDLMEFYEQRTGPVSHVGPIPMVNLDRATSCPSIFPLQDGFAENIARPRSSSLNDLSQSTEEFQGRFGSTGSSQPSFRIASTISLGLDLSTFLVNRCCSSFRLANFFYWYLMAECESSHNTINVQEMYLIVLKRFMMKLEHGSEESEHHYFKALNAQYQLIQLLTQTVSDVKAESLSRPRKLALLKEKLVYPNKDLAGSSFADFDPIPLPLDPGIEVDGILPAKTDMFKSATLPCKFVFRQRFSAPDVPNAKFVPFWKLTPPDLGQNAKVLDSSHSSYSVIFKVGNDLRQDQFAQQMISLFNRIFLDHGLDLKITPYKVLATSFDTGLVEFVDSKSVSEINSEYGSILKYFSSLASPKSKTFKNIVANFVKSCAAYCVMTYVLGVGDRHLENLLLTKNGCLFHVDFGFMLGQDPKPLPPPMKLTKEMIEAMGGSQSVSYLHFRQFCHTAYLILRRNSDLILSLVSLMSGSSIPALKKSPMAATDYIKDRLKLDIIDREAVKHIDHLLHLSSSAVVASLVERLHKIAQAMRT